MLRPTSFGYWLRLRRKALDLTREQLADRVGCSAATIRKLEAEERRPSAQIVERLAGIFEIPPAERPAFLRFARGDLQTVPPERLDEAPWRSPIPSFHSNLPAALTSLVGREQEIAQVRGYLEQAAIRLVTLVGPPGIGKTRLSIQSARAVLSAYPGGVFFIDLTPLDDPSLVATTIVKALGYLEDDRLPASQQLVISIRDKRMLLVLDNCEHLITDVAPLAAELLSGCPQLKILATSREALRIPGEWLYPVPTLGIPKSGALLSMENASMYPALTLFDERARAVLPGFTLSTGNLQAIASICTQLDGLPLAIELIAARIRWMTPQALLERFQGPLILSADGMRAVPVRQKTLHNAIDWSFALLSADEQELFAGLSVFSGGFNLQAVEAIFPSILPDKPVSILLRSLLEKSLLQRTGGSQDVLRFSMLATIRQYARSALQQMGFEAEACRAHLAYFLSLAEQGDHEMRGPAQVEWANRLEDEYDNFHAALEWAVIDQQTESALRLLYALGWSWEVGGHYTEARHWFNKITALPDAADFPAIYARLLNHLGRHSWTQENLTDARAFLNRSQQIALALGPAGETILAEALIWLGLVVHYGERDSQASRAMFERSLSLYQKWEDRLGIAISLFHLAIIQGDLKADGEARSLLEKSLALFHQYGDWFYVARTSIYLGHLALKQGYSEQAIRYFEQQLQIDRELQFWDGIAEGYRNLGFVYHQQGVYDLAEQHYEQSLAIYREHGLRKTDTLYLSALLALQRDDFGLAYRRFSDFYVNTLAIQEPANLQIFFLGLAAVAAGDNQPERAAKLCGAAQMMIKTAGIQIPTSEQAEFERHLQIARKQLGEEIFAVLQTEGSAMSVEQAIALALS